MSQPYSGMPGQQPATNPQRPPGKLRTRTVVLIIVGGLAVVGGLSSIESAVNKPAGPDPTSAQVVEVTSGLPATPPSTTQPTPTAAPTTTPAPPKPTVTPKPTVAQKPKPVVYKKISARQWKLIAKSPDSHVGEHLILYGTVTQFDSATGTDTFRANVDGIKHRPSYGFVDYPSNVILTGTEAALSNLVEDDLFTARVTVTGSLTYDTQIGGQTTVPQLRIASLSVTGSVGD
ncbi:hypothetical protein [Kribbella sp. DT2]|uniref:hypothetical protein n=1 Tax=Kribbella sp. DT2 TaxID=3393427 RepID=UPI003CF1A83D